MLAKMTCQCKMTCDNSSPSILHCQCAGASTHSVKHRSIWRNWIKDLWIHEMALHDRCHQWHDTWFPQGKNKHMMQTKNESKHHKDPQSMKLLRLRRISCAHGIENGRHCKATESGLELFWARATTCIWLVSACFKECIPALDDKHGPEKNRKWWSIAYPAAIGRWPSHFWAEND